MGVQAVRVAKAQLNLRATWRSLQQALVGMEDVPTELSTDVAACQVECASVNGWRWFSANHIKKHSTLAHHWNPRGTKNTGFVTWCTARSLDRVPAKPRATGYEHHSAQNDAQNTLKSDRACHLTHFTSYRRRAETSRSRHRETQTACLPGARLPAASVCHPPADRATRRHAAPIGCLAVCLSDRMAGRPRGPAGSSARRPAQLGAGELDSTPAPLEWRRQAWELKWLSLREPTC